MRLLILDPDERVPPMVRHGVDTILRRNSSRLLGTRGRFRLTQARVEKSRPPSSLALDQHIEIVERVRERS